MQHKEKGMNVNIEKLNQIARQVANRIVSDGARYYHREVHLVRIFGEEARAWSHTEIIARLENALRRNKLAIKEGRNVDLNRVVAIRQALHAEMNYGRTK